MPCVLAATAALVSVGATPAAAAIDRHIVFMGEAIGGYWGAWEANSNGSDPRPLPGDPEAASLSPNGRSLAFVEGGALKVSDIGGGSPVTIYTPPCCTESFSNSVRAPRFSPDGTKVAFDGAASRSNNWEIHTVNTSGTEPHQLTSEEYPGEEFAFRPEWTPNGSKLVYEYGSEHLIPRYELFSINADGTGEAGPFETSTDILSSWGISFSPPESNVSDDEYLGLNFEPLLRFHSSEKWRPLNVNAFMHEEDPANPGHSYNKICPETGCEDIPSNWQEALTNSVSAEYTPHIKMGELPEEAYPYPTSPNLECYAGGLWECNSGARTGIYYHVTPSATNEEATEAGYDYVDYWIFYRYNQDQNDPLSVDDHQGDWEGLAIAPSLTNPSSFDFAIFAQHHYFSVYAPENLRCDRQAEESEESEAACGGESEPTGQRVWDYVAVGTHASYPGVDEGGLSGICTQAQAEFPEGCHDGKAPWGANYEASDVLALPAAGEGNWVDWPGRWGDDPGAFEGLEEEIGASPSGPGNQQRFKCPWHPAESLDPTACPSSVQANTARARAATASACQNWFGNAVVMTACSPSALRRGVRDASMGHHGSLRILLGGRGGHAASLPGVAQAVGQPLRPGARIAVVGRASGDTQLFVRAQDKGRTSEAVFAHLGLDHGGQGSIAVRAGRNGPRLIWIAPDGRHARPVATHMGRLPKATPKRQRPSSVRTLKPKGQGDTAHAARRPSQTCRRNARTHIRKIVREQRMRKWRTFPQSIAEGQGRLGC